MDVFAPMQEPPGSTRNIDALDKTVFVYSFLVALLTGHESLFVIPNLVFIFVFMVFTLHLAQGKLQFRMTVITWAYPLCMIGFFIPVLLGRAPMMAAMPRFFLQGSLVYLLVLVFSTYLRDRISLLSICLGLSSGSLLASFLGQQILQTEVGTRSLGLTSNANSAGIWCLMGIMASLMVYWGLPKFSNSWKWYRFLFWPGLAYSCYFIWQTESRKSFVGIVLVLAWFASYRLVKARQKLAVVAVVVLAGIGASIFLQGNSDSPFIRRMTSTYNTLTNPTAGGYKADDSSEIRYAFLITAAELIKESPLIGYGPDAFMDLGHTRSPRFNVPRVTHFTFVDMWLQGGILAFVAYLSIYVYLLAGTIRHRMGDPFVTFILVSTIVIILINTVAGLWVDKIQWITLMLLYQHLQLCKVDHRATMRTPGLPA